ncbi:MAG: hypothetical protein ACE5RC_01635 [Nitrosopumilus sp.]
MNKSLFVVISTVMISGLLLGSMGPSVFADVDPENNPGNANGCTKSNQDKGQAKYKNPHCEIDLPVCDTSGDGIVVLSELIAWIGSAATLDEIVIIFNTADVEGDGGIDHESEYNTLNSLLTEIGVGSCP